MTIREEKIERYEEALFILWADEVALQEGRDLERENAALRLDANFRAPEEVVRRGRELISRKLAARTARSVGRRAWKFVHTAALVCLFTMLAFSAAFAASPTFRANTLNLVIETFDEGTRFSFSHQQTIQVLTIGWIPDGFEEVDRDSDKYTNWIDFESPTGGHISIVKINNSITTHTSDTEDAITKIMEINEKPAIISTKKNDIQIFITDESQNCLIQISSTNVSEADIIMVAENLIY